MKKSFIYFILLSISTILFNACQKVEEAPDVARALVEVDVTKTSVVVGNQTIKTGPEKDYEQDSKVVYKLTVSSPSALSKLIVTTTAESVSQLSHVIKTEPENVVDSAGNFTQKVNSAIVYYEYYIHPSLKPLSTSTVTFTFQNEKNYTGFATHKFAVIKKGSTDGKRLIQIDMPWARYTNNGIGTQDNLDYISGIKSSNNTLEPNSARGPFYSIDARNDIHISTDALQLADKIDFVGYRVKSTGTNPVLINGQYYLVSPSDTVVLTSNYAGASATQDVQNLLMRNTIRQMGSKLKGEGKALRKVFFKRLDNINGVGQVTPAYFDELTHDNEFPILLAGIEASALTNSGPMQNDQVFGFVMDDGRKGLIRTSPATLVPDDARIVPGTVVTVPQPNSDWILKCTIKVQSK
jgi:hypothetical protein